MTVPSFYRLAPCEGVEARFDTAILGLHLIVTERWNIEMIRAVKMILPSGPSAMRRLFVLLVLLSAAGAMFAKTSHAAGADADDLGQCLIRSTTPVDRKVLTQWAFATLALDPDVASMVAISPAQRDAINQQAGNVVTAMLVDACPEQAQRAFANGGPAAVQAAFETWGQWAITGLVSEPHVMQGMAGLLQYIDIGKLMMLSPLG